MNHRLRNIRRARLRRLALWGPRFRNFAARRQTPGFWRRQMARRAGRLGRRRFDIGWRYPGLGLRRLLLQRPFPARRTRSRLWSQPAYSRSQESESSSPGNTVPERSVAEKHAVGTAAESKTEAQPKTGRFRKKNTVGTDIFSGACGDAVEICQPEVLYSSRPVVSNIHWHNG